MLLLPKHAPNSIMTWADGAGIFMIENFNLTRNIGHAAMHQKNT